MWRKVEQYLVGPVKVDVGSGSGNTLLVQTAAGRVREGLDRTKQGKTGEQGEHISERKREKKK